MTKSELSREANRFRAAIERARDAGEFVPVKYKVERMNSFPYDCCDDVADLFTHYLYHEFGIDSIRIHAAYYDEELQQDCYHDWQKVKSWHVDLTGDQFINDSKKKEYIKDNFSAIACEMEGAAIAQVAYVNKVPFCVIRAISDKADGSSHVDFAAFTKLAVDHTIKVLRALI